MTEDEFYVERLTNTVRGSVDYWKSGPALAALGELRHKAMEGVKMAGQVEAISDLTAKVNRMYEVMRPMIEVADQFEARARQIADKNFVNGMKAERSVIEGLLKGNIVSLNPYAEGTPRHSAYQRALKDVRTAITGGE